jgi:hypothetical protein
VSLVDAWIAFPAVLAVASFGFGVLVEVASGTVLPAALRLPVGFAALVVLCDLTTSTATTAPLTVPAVAGLAAAGILLSLPWRAFPNRWLVGSALAVFLVYGAPVLLSGAATFAGYIKLDDTATWLALIDRALEHGRSLAGLAPSTYSATLRADLGTGYPIGSMVPLGVVAKLTGQDPAWAFQPYLACQAGLAALGLNELTATAIRSPKLRAGVAVIAAQPALLYGYAQWGGIKELTTVPLLVLLAALLPRAVRAGGTVRSTLPLAIGAAALLAVLNFGGAVWVAAALVPLLALAGRVRTSTFAARGGAFVAILAALSLPTLWIARAFLHASRHLLAAGSSDPLGNLIRPLSGLQVFGIWPAGDFRTHPTQMAATVLLIVLLGVAALVGVAATVRRRQWAIPFYVGISLAGCAVITAVSSPWINAKALATASPAVLLAGLAGAAIVFERGRRFAAALAGALIAGGVLWSNVLAYRAVWLAPRDQLAELQQIGQRFAGDGPALMTEYQPYGARHFLRRLDAESAGELRVDVIPLRTGGTVPKGGYADIDAFAPDTVLHFRTLVLNRSPEASRPPSPYRLVWAGTWYEVWQRAPTPTRTILEHLPFGNGSQPAAVPSCASVLRVASLATAAGGTLAYVQRPAAIVAELPAGLYPDRRQTIDTAVNVTQPGRYGVWLGGSFAAEFRLSVDGHRRGSARHRLEHPGQYVPLAEVSLARGRHTLELAYDGPSILHPGSAAHLAYPAGPLVLSTTTAELPVRTLNPAAARSLCGRRLDWLEAVIQSRR